MRLTSFINQCKEHQKSLLLFGAIAFLVALLILIIQMDVSGFHFIVPPVLGPVLQSSALFVGILGCQLIFQLSRRQQACFSAIATGVLAIGELMASILWTSLASTSQRSIVAIMTIVAFLVCSWFIGKRVEAVAWIWRALLGLVFILLALLVPPYIQVRYLQDFL